MQPQPATSAQRRSERVSIAFPLEIAGMDASGNRFSERTKTTTVSRYGCCVTLPRVLDRLQALQLRRIGTNETAVGHVVVPMGMQPEGRAYGIGTPEPCETLWGIRFSSSFYEKLIENVNDGVYFVDHDRKITYWNSGAERLSGYSSEDAVGKSCFDNLLSHVDENGKPLCGSGCPLSGVLLDGQPRESELYLRHKDGYRVPLTVRVLPMWDGAGNLLGAMQVFNDSALRQRAEKRVRELERLAFRDPLTGLPNRRFLELKVDQGLEEHRSFARSYGLLMFDLDRFKQVNDSHGHDAGDALLKAVSRTLEHGLRPVDIVGRWGGEEFMVLMPDLDAIELGDLAERCRVLIAQSSVQKGDSRVATTASIGATVLNHNDTTESALRRTDELMYQSKHSGGDRTTAG